MISSELELNFKIWGSGSMASMADGFWVLA